MTQLSKDENTIVLTNMDGTSETIDLSGIIDTTGDIVINFDDYTINTSYAVNSSYTIGGGDTISISDGTYTLDTNSVDWINNIYTNDTRIDPDKIERMCKEYPALEKVWRNFKSVYDMCKQDFEGKKKAGEIDDDIPF